MCNNLLKVILYVYFLFSRMGKISKSPSRPKQNFNDKVAFAKLVSTVHAVHETQHHALYLGYRVRA